MPRMHNEIFTVVLDLYSHPLSRNTFYKYCPFFSSLIQRSKISTRSLCESEIQTTFAIFIGFHCKKVQHFNLNSVKSRTMHYWPAEVLVQLGCTLQVGLTEQALCKWMDFNKRQPSCINPRPGVLLEQAGDNPRHLAFERPPGEYARGEGERRSVKAAWNKI